MSEALMPVRGPYPDSESPSTYDSGAVTPNLGLVLGHMSRASADNFVTLDSVVPVVPAGAFLQNINATTPQSLNFAVPTTSLYNVAIYLKSNGTGIAGSTYTKTITYTAADGSGAQTISIVLHLDTPNVVMENYPLFALAGTNITTVGAYSAGAAGTPFTLSERIVEMPV